MLPPLHLGTDQPVGTEAMAPLFFHGSIDEALRCRGSGSLKCIACNLYGHFYMAAYQAYFSGQLERHEFTEEMLQRNMQALSELPTV